MLITSSPVSTGRLPAAERDLVAEAQERSKSIDEGKNADYIPALVKLIPISACRSFIDVLTVSRSHEQFPVLPDSPQPAWGRGSLMRK